MSDPTEKPKKPKKMCPHGHPVGSVFGKASCSQKVCGQDLNTAIQGGVPQEQSPLKLTPLEGEAPEDFQHRQRALAALVPAGLKGDDAVKWSQEKMASLLPEAIANVAWNLRYGSAKQKDEATDKVLRANGMDRTEARTVQPQGLIVLNFNGSTEVPWLERMNKKTGETE